MALLLGFNLATMGYQTYTHGVCFFSSTGETLVPSALFFPYVGFSKSKFHVYSFFDNRNDRSS